MRPPDQIPDRAAPNLKGGDVCYFWTGRAYSEKTVVAPHTHYAAVTIADGNGPMIVKPEEVISAEQFKAEQREEARMKYDWLIRHWNAGTRRSKDIAEVTGESARAIGQMIAAAKRWGLIEPDKEPCKATS